MLESRKHFLINVEQGRNYKHLHFLDGLSRQLESNPCGLQGLCCNTHD